MLRILASQSVVALRNAALHRRRAPLARTEERNAAACAQAEELAARNEDR